MACLLATRKFLHIQSAKLHEFRLIQHLYTFCSRVSGRFATFSAASAVKDHPHLTAFAEFSCIADQTGARSAQHVPASGPTQNQRKPLMSFATSHTQGASEEVDPPFSQRSTVAATAT